MFRPLIRKACHLLTVSSRNSAKSQLPVLTRCSHGNQETEEEFDNRYVQYFNQPDIDGWMVRKAMNELHGFDLIPEPKIIIAALHACRRINEFALTVRFLESVKDQCGQGAKKVWPYIMQEVGPTMQELGIPTLEEMAYDKPELFKTQTWDV